MSELLPCPFCGGVAKHLPQYWGSKHDADAVTCTTPKCPGLAGGYASPAEATKAWNTRARHPEPAQAQAQVSDAELKYAISLATWLWANHYRDDAQKWEPLGEMMGVLTQIDNMISGMERARHPAPLPDGRS